jgi:hypothetical protein
MKGIKASVNGARRNALRLLLVLVALAPLGYAIYREWPELRISLEGVEWKTFAVAQLLLLAVMGMVGSIPWASLHHLGIRFPYQKATGIYFFTQIFKYLPGGIWAFPGRVAVYQLMNVGSAQSVISVFRETTAMFLGAAIVGLLGLLQGLSLTSSLRLAIGIGIAASTVVILLIQLPWSWRFLASLKLFPTSQMVAYREIDPRQRNLAWLPLTVAGSVLFWLCFGLPFRQMAMAVFPQVESLSWFEASSIFALAWCAGFVIVFVPAGIGVREGALAFLLNGVMPLGAALSLALLSRIAWILAEGFWIILTLIWVSRSKELSWGSFRRLRE